jgi:4-hydroxy-3-polyprenylbenzoate decarboxylase
VDEAEVGGAIRQQPIELVKCASCDLEVPAGAEIVIEGEVVKERRREGPFAEYTGYATGGTESPVFKVKQITHRDAPILVFANPGKPWNEEGVSDSIVLSAVLAGELKKAGVPFRSLYVPPHNLAVIVSARPPYPGFVHTLACALWGSKAGSLRPYIIVVGDDVDITNADEVFWCLTSRLHPINGIHAQKGTPGLPLWPFLTPEEKRVRKGTRLLLDATFPAEWDRKEVPVPVDFESGWPADIKEKILARWKEYGY